MVGKRTISPVKVFEKQMSMTYVEGPGVLTHAVTCLSLRYSVTRKDPKMQDLHSTFLLSFDSICAHEQQQLEICFLGKH